MAIHISNFGSFSAHLTDCTDIDGYVPEAGDKPEDFNFEGDEFTADFDDNGNGYEGYAEEQWDAFVEKATTATLKASQDMDEWRTQ